MRQGTGELDVKDVREVNGADGRQKSARAFLRTSTANYVTDRAFHAGVISDVTLEATPRSEHLCDTTVPGIHPESDLHMVTFSRRELA